MTLSRPAVPIRAGRAALAAWAALAALAAFGALPLFAHAQARFSINNPLIKPPSRALAASPNESPVPAAVATARVPVARPVDGGPAPSPVQGGGGGGGLPSQSPESAARDELSAYAVVAIVGDAAVLRTNVGLNGAGAPSPNSGTGGSLGGGGGMQSPQGGAGHTATSHPPRQQAMRVRTGQPVMAGGTAVIPTVGASTVEFRMANGRGGLLFTASLDSNSPQAFIPATREAMDPAVAARATPTPLSLRGPATGSGNGSSGGSGTGGTGSSGSFGGSGR